MGVLAKHVDRLDTIGQLIFFLLRAGALLVIIFLLFTHPSTSTLVFFLFTACVCVFALFPEFVFFALERI
jgi:hypothetical protein